VPFEYKRWSALHFTPGSYPPVPGVLSTPQSMAVNLGSTPVYVTWDTTDSLTQVTTQGARLLNVLSTLGGTVESKTVSATFDPDTLTFAPHSWLVLDEQDLFDFFEDKTVDRTPAAFRALLDESGPVAWMDVTQRVAGQFSALEAAALAGVPEESNPALSATKVDNCTDLAVDVGATLIVGTDPIEVTAGSIDGEGFRLSLNGAECPPVYLVDALLGTLVPTTDYDPLTGELTTVIGAGTLRAADAVCQPPWTTTRRVTPKQLGVGDPLDLMIDAPPDTTTAWTLVGFVTALGSAKGYTLTVQFAGALLLPLPLDIGGDLALQGKLPNDPSLAGLDLLMQVIGVDGAGTVVTASNMWVMPVQ
jgi:hypothetical protein